MNKQTTQAEEWTVGRLLTWTTDYLKSHGVEGARLDAEVLLAEARGCKRIDLYAAFNDPASDEVRAAFRELVRRRSEGTPVAYLVGRREFYSLDFSVSPDVLIPRPETELLVIALLDRLKQHAGQPASVLDLGTGSGIIAICAARHAAGARITATDVSPAALKIAAANAARLEVAERIRFLQSDLLASVPAGEPFDFIVSNPPYISTAEMAALPTDVRNHEPHLALHGGEHGWEIVARLIDESAPRLRSGGWLLVEISPMLKESVEGLIRADSRYELHPTSKDLAGLPRILQARRTTS